MSELHRTILAAARAEPDRLALDAGRQGMLSYAQLLDAAQDLQGVVAGKASVGVLSNRGAETYHAVLAPFFAGSPLEGDLAAICRDAFDFPVPLRPLVEAKDRKSTRLNSSHT